MAPFTMTQLEADIAFLVARAAMAGGLRCDDRRSWGLSSNAIVDLAYGGQQDWLPSDWSDYAACVRAVRLLPRHRQTPEVRDALRRARAAVTKKYPEQANGRLRRIAREKREAEQSARPRRRRR